MTQEEKAKAYDEVREKIAIRFGSNVADEIFSQFEMSEDERIRKALKEYFINSFRNNGVAAICGVHIKDVFAWLEKQGDKDKLIQELGEYKVKYTQEVLSQYLEKQGGQNQPDKIEPKFKVGDWVVQENIGTYKVVEVCESWYEVIDSQNKHYSIGFDKEYMCHIWSIKDAKDGDVLAESEGNVILMFRRIGNTEWDDVIDYHCYYECYREDFFIQEDVEHWGNTENSQLKPATKEQCDLLFSKMKEAGYEWDADAKKLNKFEKKTDSGWSEEDEEFLRRAINTTKDNYPVTANWLKSLKDRIQPQIKQKWSEEDEKMLNHIIGYLHSGDDFQTGIDWLKSIEQRIG